jgi:hypothetical protein
MVKQLSDIKSLSVDQFENYDLTGKSGLSKADCVKAFNEFLISHEHRFFFTQKLQSVKVMNNLEESEKIDVDINLLKETIKNSLIYIGYTDGNFVWTDFLLICEGSDGTDDGFVYLNIDKQKGIGRIFSALHEEISKFGKTTKHDSNLLKMMKRNKFELIDNNQKEFLFGKGHMSAGNLKTVVKKDLDVIFDFMKESKNKANSGDLSPVDFDLSKLRYFKFRKI